MFRIPKQGLSNIQLTAMFSKNKHFLGVISKDEINRINPNKHGFLIINMADSHDQGSHWTMVWNGEKECMYFDSFGIFPPSIVERWMRRTRKPCVYSTTKFQDQDSSTCGGWSALVAQLLSQGKSFREIVNRILPQMIPNAIDWDKEKILVSNK